MAKDAEKTPATRLNEIRREWGLDSVDEATAQAQNKALEPLHEWLKKGVDSPEVVVRSVQVLLANPETPGVEKRRSVSEVVEKVSDIWARAGVGSQGLLGLQAMLIAAWPYDLKQGEFDLVPMLDSAWSTKRGGARYQPRIDSWRTTVCKPSRSSPHDIEAPAAANLPAPASPGLETPKTDAHMQHLRQNVNVQCTYNGIANQLVGVLDAHSADIKALAKHFATLAVPLGATTNAINSATSKLTDDMNVALERNRSQVDLLWWGQARYCQRLSKPYRRIENLDERLWWMAWEASKPALGLEVEPAASFLVEALLQTGVGITEKLPLRQWIQALIAVLRPVSGRPALAKALRDLAEVDCLGLPVTWARLQVSKESPGTMIDDIAREELGMDLDAEIDRGEWASWVFREALLDWKLED